jgi:S-methylmethionine-dependent homocysteine/selenocysteine methylase
MINNVVARSEATKQSPIKRTHQSRGDCHDGCSSHTSSPKGNNTVYWARVVGGCCDSTPEPVAGIVKVLKG